GEGAEALLALPILLSLDGRALSLLQVRNLAAAEGRVFLDHQRTPLVDALLAQGTVVIMSASHDDAGGYEAQQGFDAVARVLAGGLAGGFAAGSALERLLDILGGNREAGAWTRASQLLTRPGEALVAVELVDDPAALRLVARTQEISLRALGQGSGTLRRIFSKLGGAAPRIGYRRLVAARFHGAGGSVTLAGGRRPLFVIAHAIAPLMALPTDELMISALDGQPEAAVNCEHPHFRALLRLYERAPDMAAYCLAKSLLLQVDRNLELDLALMGAALGRELTEVG
ncbi:MAG: hypothetical protein KC457_15165, partial [Myxococcales bacterium]|nr:hypothetical protein [Myxococcales bacterium]